MGSIKRHINLLHLLLVSAQYVSAQSPPSSNSWSDPYLQNANFKQSIAIVIVVLISAFFFMVFFSIYIRNRAGRRLDPRSTRAGGAGAAAGRSLRQRGINPEVLVTFPTFGFSEVKAHKIGKSTLECAVCLSEFEDEETLRLLPKCDHVFHPDCIDAWLAAHVTCPVCRCNLEEIDATDSAYAPDVVLPLQEPAVQEINPVQVENQQVTIQINEEDEERKAEIENLERFINMKRSKSRAARPAKFPRSHSTGHSLVLPGENLERFTLRLPDRVRREVLQRTTSFAAFPREGSSRRRYRRGEGSMERGARSIQLGSPERWGSFLVRTLSVKNWGRRGDGDESSKGGGIFRWGESTKGGKSVKGKSYRLGDSVNFEAQTSSVA